MTWHEYDTKSLSLRDVCIENRICFEHTRCFVTLILWGDLLMHFQCILFFSIHVILQWMFICYDLKIQRQNVYFLNVIMITVLQWVVNMNVGNIRECPPYHTLVCSLLGSRGVFGNSSSKCENAMNYILSCRWKLRNKLTLEIKSETFN